MDEQYESEEIKKIVKGYIKSRSTDLSEEELEKWSALILSNPKDLYAIDDSITRCDDSTRRAVAEEWSRSSHYVKSSIGIRALEELDKGADSRTVIERMNAQWSAYVGSKPPGQ